MSDSLTTVECDAFRAYLKDLCGLDIPEKKMPQLSELVFERIKHRELTDFSQYRQFLRLSPEAPNEIRALITHLTIGETYFCRNPAHWDVFSNSVVPWIRERNALSGKASLRVWSAGCSTGEEPYTIAMMLQDCLPTEEFQHVQVIGTDINSESIKTAMKAVYSINAFRGVANDFRDRHFVPVNSGQYKPQDSIREKVTFQEMNLFEGTDRISIKEIDIVFCRNVLIYFDRSGFDRIIERFHRCIVPSGFLFIGHSETLRSGNPHFASVNVRDGIVHMALPLKHSVSSKHQGRTPIRSSGTGNSGERPPTPSQAKPLSVRVPSHAPKKTTRPPVSKPIPHREKLDRDAGKESVGASDDSDREASDLLRMRDEAMNHFLADHPVEAKRIYENIIRLDKRDGDSMIALALLKAGSGDRSDAVDLCVRALSLCPNSAEAHCTRGLIHEGNSDDASAISEFNEAVRLDPNLAVANFRLACIHSRKKNHGDAKQAAANALRGLIRDEERRIRIFSGGFDREALKRMCEQQLKVATEHSSESALRYGDST